MYYDDTLTVRQAREQFLSDNGFTLEEYGAKWVYVTIGPLPVLFPNLPARQRAIVLHDLHHVATGYETTIAGEGEMAAWELAAGCGTSHCLNVVFISRASSLF